MTLYETSLIVEGVSNAKKASRDEMLFLAWHTAYLTAYAPEKSTKFMKLEKLIGGDRSGKTMTADQMEATLRGWLGSRRRTG